MKDTAREIRNIVSSAMGALFMLDARSIASRPPSGGWSKKEILGHLIDSASNNHQRIVRGIQRAAETFPEYDQDAWVRVQAYGDASWVALVQLWFNANFHLAWVIEHIPDDALDVPVNIGKAEPAALRTVVESYHDHLRHHLAQLLET